MTTVKRLSPKKNMNALPHSPSSCLWPNKISYMIKNMKYLVAVMIGLLGVHALNAQSLKFGFDDSGTTTTDSVAGVSLNLVDASGNLSDIHGPAGSGVYGNGQALKLTNNVYASAALNCLTTTNSTVHFGTLTNFTITMWIKPTKTAIGTLNYSPRLFCFGATTTQQATNTLMFENNQGPLNLFINNNTARISPTFSEPSNQWTFLATTWDGQNVQFYYGSETNSLTLAGSVAAPAGPINVGSSFCLAIGNLLSVNTRSFVGWMDDVRFYTNAQSSSSLETVRQQALVLSPPLNVALATCSQASLSWTASPYATGYIIKRSTTSGAETNYAVTATNNFVDASVSVGATYYYKVVATNSAAMSASSSEVSGTIISGTPFTFVSQPASLSVFSGATATFSAVISGSPSGYLWQYSTNQGSSWTDIPTATSTNYTTAPVTYADNGKQYRIMVVGTCGASPSLAATLAVVSQQLKFAFEDGGTTSTDSVAGVSLNLVDANGNATDYHGPAGSGVYGNGHALNLTSGIPTASGPTAVTTSNATVNFGSLTNFTMTMWIKPTASFNGNYLPRLFCLGSTTNINGTNTLVLSDYGGPLGIFLNSASPLTSSGFSAPTGQWMFLAVTWDGQTVQYYNATETNAITSLGSSPAALGAINVGTNFNLAIGNLYNGIRSFVGWMDDVRFSTGVGSAALLEGVRQQALVLSPPLNVALTTCSQAALSWTASPYATGYIIKRSTTSGAETNYAITATSSFVDASVLVGTTYFYKIVATNATMVSAASSEMSGTILNQSLATFITQPASQIVCPGDSPTFSATLSGGSGLSYLWEYSTNQGANWISIPIATSTNYTPSSVSGTDDGTQFRLVVISGCATVVSVVATLSVETTPASIVQQPFDQTVVAGWPAVFGVQITGSNMVYQWRKNTVNLTNGIGVSGATTAVMTLTNLTTADSGALYDCVVGLPCVAVISGQAQLTVNATPTNNLLLQFDFEDAGNGATTLDSVSGMALNLSDSSLAPQDYHGQLGSGVSGVGRALDFATGSPGIMGGVGPLAYAVNDSTVNFGTLGSFTVTLWVKPSSPYTNNFSRFFVLGPYGTTDNGQANSLGFLRFGGSLAAYVNTTGVLNSSPISGTVNQWIFVAATWDGQKVRYYTGSQVGAVAALGEAAAAPGPVAVGNSVNLLIGNNVSQSRSFAGMMDSVRFYRGAAPMDALEKIRQSSAGAPGPQIITGIKATDNGSVTLSFSGTSYANYLLQMATNLTPPTVWNTISTNTTDGAGLWQFIDSNATNRPTGFYRSLGQ